MTSKYLGSTEGLTVISADDQSVTYITSEYNSGVQVGDIKLAALSDTDATNVVGSELVTNGTFDTDVSGWTLSEGDGTIAYSSGTAVVTYGTAPTSFQQTFATVIGKTYTITATLTGGTSSIRQFYYKDSSDVSVPVNDNPSIPQSSTFTATTTTLKVWMRVAGSGTGTYDNISVRLADQDRSVNANGLQVHGTITKTPVATGADLVAYSGFSSSNYLEQPYNSDLDFGTGDFSVMGWVNLTATGSTEGIFTRGDNLTGAYIWLRETAGILTLKVSDDSNATSDSVSTATLPTGVWHLITFGKRDNTYFIDVNNTSVSTPVSAAAATLSNTSATLILGLEFNGSGAVNGSLALFRISATAPSAQQIKDIYEAERPLFNENAQAALYGTSDSVTALAHDSDTNLLHVGTSAGRSVFQGLQRVDNTTTAVGSAISASNGLVVED